MIADLKFEGESQIMFRRKIAYILNFFAFNRVLAHSTKGFFKRPKIKHGLEISAIVAIILSLILSSIPPKIQKAKTAPGTRTKTLEFFVGQNVSTTGIASGTGATYGFSAFFPDAVSSPVRSAYILYHTVISASDSTATTFRLGLQGGSMTTLLGIGQGHHLVGGS